MPSYDFDQLSAATRYKLLVNLILPRPIAFVTTVDEAGVLNAGAYSFFNVFSDDPALVIIGAGGSHLRTGDHKDTVKNIQQGGDFVVNMVDEALLPKMNIASVEYPPEVDEFQVAGLTAIPSIKVRSPRVGEAPVQLECRHFKSIDVGSRARTLILGEVVHVHVRDDCIDPERLYVDIDKLNLVGRIHGAGWYSRLGDRIHVPRHRGGPVEP